MIISVVLLKILIIVPENRSAIKHHWKYLWVSSKMRNCLAYFDKRKRISRCKTSNTRSCRDTGYGCYFMIQPIVNNLRPYITSFPLPRFGRKVIRTLKMSCFSRIRLKTASKENRYKFSRFLLFFNRLHPSTKNARNRHCGLSFAVLWTITGIFCFGTSLLKNSRNRLKSECILLTWWT